MKDVPLGLAVCHCHALNPQIGQKLQERRKTVVDRRDKDEEDKHDADDDARRFERLRKGRPGDALEFGERLLDLSACADEDVGLLIPLFCRLLGRVLLFDVGLLGVELFGAVVGLLHSFTPMRERAREIYLDSL